MLQVDIHFFKKWDLISLIYNQNEAEKIVIRNSKQEPVNLLENKEKEKEKENKKLFLL